VEAFDEIACTVSTGTAAAMAATSKERFARSDIERDARRPSHHSDNEKFRSDLNGSETDEISEWPLRSLRYFEDFQSDYEGLLAATDPKCSVQAAVSKSNLRWLQVRATISQPLSNKMFSSKSRVRL
jgi:hypothetical protein